MSGFVAKLPLRVPLETDLGGQLGRWLDQAHVQKWEGRPGMTSADCREDLDRLDQMRRNVYTACRHGVADALPHLHVLQEYAAALELCEEQGFPYNSGAVDDSGTTRDDEHDRQHRHKLNKRGQQHHSPLSSASLGNSSLANMLEFPWKSSDNQEEVDGTLAWERANVLWNLAIVQAHQAYAVEKTPNNPQSRTAWKQAGLHLQTAASLLRYLQTDLLPAATERSFPSHDLSASFLTLWERFCLADAQYAFYQAVAAAPRPLHALLAKVSAAAIPLYGVCEELLLDDDDYGLDTSSSASITANASATGHAAANQFRSKRLQIWGDAVRAWGMWMSALCEYHQAQTHADKGERGPAHARLEAAQKFGSLCLDFCNSEEESLLDDLAELVYVTLQDMETQLEQAEQANRLDPVEIPDRNDLPEVPPQTMVEVEKDVSSSLPKLAPPLFTSGPGSVLRRYEQTFRYDMQRLLTNTTLAAEDKTDQGRRALATVNLPHSVTAYQQESQGGGIPDALWERVRVVQDQDMLRELKQSVWELCDIAERARSLYQTVQENLKEDLRVDSLFRSQNSTFEGHNVSQVQKSFHTTLENYDSLLTSAREGDQLVMQRVELLDTDPKYKLLQFRKSQLDRLLPAGDQNVDVSTLSRMLVELSALFQRRDVSLEELRNKMEAYDFTGELVQVDELGLEAEAEYKAVFQRAKDSFQGALNGIERSMEEQSRLVREILTENDIFMHERENSRAKGSTDRSITMIEDAVDEVEQLSTHLKEGREFYDSVLPKLEKLRKQVGDVSARLTMERCEYEDNTQRNRQEADDARMAANLSDHGQGQQTQTSIRYIDNGSGSSPRRPMDRVATPGMHPVSHELPQVRVDDEKVASLVAMDFDPNRVFAALLRYDNNFEQALNDLLSG